jgi:hypothetical protein
MQGKTLYNALYPRFHYKDFHQEFLCIRLWIHKVKNNYGDFKLFSSHAAGHFSDIHAGKSVLEFFIDIEILTATHTEAGFSGGINSVFLGFSLKVTTQSPSYGSTYDEYFSLRVWQPAGAATNIRPRDRFLCNHQRSWIRPNHF